MQKTCPQQTGSHNSLSGSASCVVTRPVPPLQVAMTSSVTVQAKTASFFPVKSSAHPSSVYKAHAYSPEVSRPETVTTSSMIHVPSTHTHRGDLSSAYPPCAPTITCRTKLSYTCSRCRQTHEESMGRFESHESAQFSLPREMRSSSF